MYAKATSRVWKATLKNANFSNYCAHGVSAVETLPFQRVTYISGEKTVVFVAKRIYREARQESTRSLISLSVIDFVVVSTLSIWRYLTSSEGHRLVLGCEQWTPLAENFEIMIQYRTLCFHEYHNRKLCHASAGVVFCCGNELLSRIDSHPQVEKVLCQEKSTNQDLSAVDRMILAKSASTTQRLL